MKGYAKFVLVLPVALAWMSVDAEPATAECNWERYAEVDHWELELTGVSVDGEPVEGDLAAGAFDVSLRSGERRQLLIVEEQEGDQSFEAVFYGIASDDMPQDFRAQLDDQGGE